MDPKKEITPKVSSMAQLQSELDRALKNEKQLMVHYKKLKGELATLLRAESDLKKANKQVAALEIKAERQDLYVEKLREDLQKVKTDLWHEQTQRAEEKTTSDERIVRLEKKCKELREKISLEKMLWEQKEKELETIDTVKRESKKLTLQKQTLHHQVQDLTEYKNFATKKIEEQRQLLKMSDLEHEQIKQELNETSKMARKYKDKIDSLIPLKGSFQSLQKHVEDQTNENKKYKTQINADEEKISKLKRELSDLRVENDSLSSSQALRELELQKIKEENKKKTQDIENQKEEVKRQNKLILALEQEVKYYVELKLIDQNQKKKETRSSLDKDQLIIRMRNTITEFESKQRQQMIRSQNVEATRNLAVQNLFKAQAEIGKKMNIIHQKNEEIRGKCSEVSAKKEELVNVERKYRSVKYQLENAKRQLSESKLTQLSIDSANKNQLLAEKNLVELTAEKDKMAKELMRYKELEVQQQQKNDLLRATADSKENMLKEYTRQIESLSLEKVELQRKCEVMTVRKQSGLLQYISRKGRTCNERSIYHNIRMGIEKEFQCMKLAQEEKDKEIEELKRRLNDTLKKFQPTRRDNIRLQEKLKALQGSNMMWEKLHENQNEEIQRLKDKLRKLLLESTEKSRHTILSSVSHKPKPTSTDKLKDQSGHIPGHRRFKIMSTKSQCEFQNKPKLAPTLGIFGSKSGPYLPPISNKPQLDYEDNSEQQSEFGHTPTKSERQTEYKQKPTLPPIRGKQLCSVSQSPKTLHFSNFPKIHN